MAGVAGLGIALLTSGVPVAAVYSIPLFALAFLGGTWSGAALLTKRMHDLDLSTGRAMCVYGANLAVLGFAAYKPSFGVLMTVFVGGASVWLLVMPGSPGRNRYGPLRRERRAFARASEPTLQTALRTTHPAS